MIFRRQIHATQLALACTLAVTLQITARADYQLAVAEVTASASHAMRQPINLVNDSGMDELGFHDNNWANMWLAANASPGDNPRGGTVPGSYWVQFDLGRVVTLSTMGIWNYNEAVWYNMGLKGIVVQYSTTGSTDPTDWLTAYDSTLPVATATGTGPSPVDLTIDLHEASAQYIVITADMPPSHSHNPSYNEAGLSEVRFYSTEDPTADTWLDPQFHATLSNSTLEAKFQAGLLYELRDTTDNTILLSKNPATIESTQPLFGQTGVTLDFAAVSQTATAAAIETHFSWTNGDSWHIHWTLDPASQDLILQMSAQTPAPAEGLYTVLSGADITNHSLVTVDSYGRCHIMQAPFHGSQFGGDLKNQMPHALVQPLVALFERDNAGWLLEGRDLNLGPSNIRPFGEGNTADLVISRAFPDTLATTSPELFEVRIRTYSGPWQDAVDPYVLWMQNDVGFVPIEDKTYTWIQNIRTQSYVTCTDFTALANLAARVDPTKTYLGRQAEYRYYVFDQGYPDFRPTPTAATWIAQARSLGFPVGVHTNISAISWSFTDLIDEMAPGLLQIGTDDEGNPIYYGLSTHVYCSPAYAPWRAHFIDAIADVVAAGANVIYLDEAGPNGKFVVDGVTATQGVMIMEQEIMDAYPGVVIQTEGFNPCTARHAYFALVQHPLNHPLSGYIFSHFIRIVPEGYLYSATDIEHLDGFMAQGYVLPGSDTSRSESWLQIIDAFQENDLLADSRIPLGPGQTFGYAGKDGITAFFEQTPTTRSLVVYQPGQPPAVHGLRHTGIATWPGPGSIEDWLIFDDNLLMGLDPQRTYFFDTNAGLDPCRFHITSVPENFMPYQNDNRRIIPQEVGHGDSNFRIFFTGHGQIEMYVPDEYDVYLDDQPVTTDSTTHTATIAVSAPTEAPSVIRVFRRTDQMLSGYWAALAWDRPHHKLTTLGTHETIYPPYGFGTNVTGEGFLIGRLPRAKSIRLQGQFGMRNDAVLSKGDAVIKINGRELLRLDPGMGPPYSLIPFDVDITDHAAQYIMLEFLCDGDIRGVDPGDWDAPQIIITDLLPLDCQAAMDQGYGLITDVNQDCRVDIGDLAILGTDWLNCFDPANSTCEPLW